MTRCNYVIKVSWRHKDEVDVIGRHQAVIRHRLDRWDSHVCRRLLCLLHINCPVIGFIPHLSRCTFAADFQLLSSFVMNNFCNNYNAVQASTIYMCYAWRSLLQFMKETRDPMETVHHDSHISKHSCRFHYVKYGSDSVQCVALRPFK